MQNFETVVRPQESLRQLFQSYFENRFDLPLRFCSMLLHQDKRDVASGSSVTMYAFIWRSHVILCGVWTFLLSTLSWSLSLLSLHIIKDLFLFFHRLNPHIALQHFNHMIDEAWVFYLLFNFFQKQTIILQLISSLLSKKGITAR